MKIIHTSDWHLGQIFNEYDRTPEHMAFLTRLRHIIRTEHPDALLISGDIYHNSVPSYPVQKFYTESILALHSDAPYMTIVITAGNHDSGTRLEIDQNLWNYLGVKVVGSLAKNGGQVDLDKHIIEIHSHDGALSGYVIALPHIYKSNYPHVALAYDIDSSDDTARQQMLYKALQDRVKSINSADLPVVMMAHLAVSGCDISGHDDSIGGMEYTSLEAFGNGYDYLALGHIHHPQTLGKSMQTHQELLQAPVARYSGSPLAVSFDEDYKHTVSIVEIDNHFVRIREEIMPLEYEMVTLPSHPAPFEEALEEMLAYPDDKKAYIRMNVAIKDYLPQNAAFKAAAALEKKAARYCHIKTTRVGKIDEYNCNQMTVNEIRKSSPMDIARKYYRQCFATDMDKELENMLAEVVNDLQKEQSDEI